MLTSSPSKKLLHSRFLEFFALRLILVEAFIISILIFPLSFIGVYFGIFFLCFIFSFFFLIFFIRDLKSPNIFLTRCLANGGGTKEYSSQNTLAKLGDLGLCSVVCGPYQVCSNEFCIIILSKKERLIIIISFYFLF